MPIVEAPAADAARGPSVCLYCGSSNAADPAFLAAASEFGETLAREGVRLVYGGGGIGTLEEVVELMIWRRLDLHRKPIVFLDMAGFWQPFFRMIAAGVEARVTPAWLPDTWGAVESVAEVLPTVRRMQAEADRGPGFFGYPKPEEVRAKA